MDQDILHRCVIRARVEFAAQARARGELLHAELLYISALRDCEAVAGRLSPLTGYVLLDLHELYEELGLNEASAQVWEHIRQIFLDRMRRINSARRLTAQSLMRRLCAMVDASDGED